MCAIQSSAHADEDNTEDIQLKVTIATDDAVCCGLKRKTPSKHEKANGLICASSSSLAVDELNVDRWHSSCTVRSGLANQPINRLIIDRWPIRAGTSTAPRSTHPSGTMRTPARTRYTRVCRSPRGWAVRSTCCRWLCRADSPSSCTDC